MNVLLKHEDEWECIRLALVLKYQKQSSMIIQVMKQDIYIYIPT